MRNSSARVLEFEGLRDLLQGYVQSDLGRARVADLRPSTDLAWIQNQHQLTSEVREFRRVGGNFEFAGLSDITRLLEKSRIEGAALEFAINTGTIPCYCNPRRKTAGYPQPWFLPELRARNSFRPKN